MQIRASRISTSIALAITEDGDGGGGGRGDEHFLGDGDAPPATRQENEGAAYRAGNSGSSGARRKSNVTTPLLKQQRQQQQEHGQAESGDGASQTSDRSKKVSWTAVVAYFFALFRLYLTRYRPGSFRALRRQTWQLDEDEYLSSFPTPIRRRRDAIKADLPQGHGYLVPVGDLGYSGSTFFATANGKFLVKSLPRRFEHRFFTHELLDAYIAHNQTYPDSLLVRITDMPYSPGPSLGGILGTAPTHHIVMENLLYGKEQADEDSKDKWETYDLKPEDYFFPERDIADGRLVPQSVKDRLIDEFPDKHIVVSLDDREKLLATLNHDTQLLASRGAVDYSLFLVRHPKPTTPGRPPALHSGVPCRWREGVDDVQGQWTYRVVVLDFFWAKSALQAKAMTGLVDAYNVVADQGPMSITAEPGEYRTRFMKMVDNLVLSETDRTRL